MKRKKAITIISLAVAISTLLPVNITTVNASSESAEWTLLSESSDEFNGNSLDSSKWNTYLWYDVTSALAFKDSNVSVQDGNLVLTAKKESYNGKNYTCGAVESKFWVPGGDCYVEVRAKALDKDANVLSAIWLQASPLSSLMNPNPEIDIMEAFNFSNMSSTLHTWEQTPNGEVHFQRGTNEYYTGHSDISDDFHTYGVERSNGKLRFYFDGKLAWEKDAPDDSFTELARHMVLSLEGHLGNPVDSKLPSQFLIDYVRTYYRGDFSQSPTHQDVYAIVNRNSGLYLAVPESQISSNAQLIQEGYHFQHSAKWTTIKNSDGTYTLNNMATGKSIDLSGNSNYATNGIPIIQYPTHKEANQKWYIVPTDNGYFKIISQVSGKALVVLDASKEAGAPIIQWSYEGSDTNDEWAFHKLN